MKTVRNPVALNRTARRKLVRRGLAVQHINKLKPRFLLVSGDMSNACDPRPIAASLLLSSSKSTKVCQVCHVGMVLLHVDIAKSFS